MRLRSLSIILLLCITGSAFCVRTFATTRKQVLDLSQGKVVLADYLAEWGNPLISGSWLNWAFHECGVRHDPHNLLPNEMRDIASKYYPLIGPYDTSDPAVLEYHIRLAQASGIDGFLVDWWGLQNVGTRLEVNRTFGELLKLSGQLNFGVAIDYTAPIFYLNTGGVSHVSISDRAQALKAVHDDLAFVIKSFGSSPAYLKFQGKPVIALYLAEEPFTVDEWKQIYAALKIEGLEAYYISLTVSKRGELTFYPYVQGFFPWIWSEDLEDATSFIHDHAGQLRAFAAGHDIRWGLVVRPGFDDSPVAHWCAGKPVQVDRRDGTLYNETWRAALANDPRWILISTFNDWNEATIIEPSLQFGYQYLYTTNYFASGFKNAQSNYAGIPVPYMIYNATVAVRQAESEGRSAGLDPAYEALQLAKQVFQSGQYSDAARLAKQATQLALQATIPQTSTTGSSTLMMPLQPVSSTGWNLTYVVAAIGIVTFVAISVMAIKRRNPRTRQE